MGATRITRASCASANAHTLLVAAVHAVAQFEAGHTQIVARLHSDRDLVGVGDLRVASRLLDAHDWRSVGDRVHHVLHRTGDGRTICRGEVHVIEAALLHGKRTHHSTVTLSRHRDGAPIVKAQGTAGNRTGHIGPHRDRRSHHGGYIACVVDVLHWQPAVRGKTQVE